MKFLKHGEYYVHEGPFSPEWESLKTYQCPDWFREGKLGMWAHWGPQAVPGAGDWYARHMYIEGHKQYEYHLEHFGHPSEVGYKDIIHQWKAESFDPVGLIDLYKRAGAKYFTAMGVHHDNFDCWDSTYHRWNAVNFGPKRDIVGLWRKAALEAGLRFGVTEHMERTYSWLNTSKGADTKGPKAGVPYDGNDPEYADLYLVKHDDSGQAYPKNPPEWWKWHCFARIFDLVQRYQPDLLYTDGAIPFGEVGRKMLANFYNVNVQKHGRLEAVYCLKDMREKDKATGADHGEYVDGIGVEDVERGVITDIKPEPWQTDTCIGGWYYNRFLEYKTSRCVIQLLADIVSKNGNLLLNYPLRGDGTLDDKATSVVRDLGDWMKVNGEAIYGTVPWTRFGEGPTRSSGGHMKEAELPYTAADFRFTKKGDTLYAIMLGWPENGKTVIASLPQNNGTVRAVRMLGAQGTPEWSQSAAGLEVNVPNQQPCASAWVFKIALD